MTDPQIRDVRRLVVLAFVALAILLALFCAMAPAADDEVPGWVRKLADEETRDQARDALRDLGLKAVPDLIPALRDPSAVVRSEVAFVLGRIGSREAVPALMVALADREGLVREKCAYALGEIADPRALNVLVKTLSDPVPAVRANACFALGQIGDPRPARDLVKALADESELVRNYASSALGFTGERRVLPALAWVSLNDKSNYVRALATSSLGNLDDGRVCGVLVQLLREDDYLVRARAVEALRALTGDRKGYDARDNATKRAQALARWENWYRQNFEKLGHIDPQKPLDLYKAWPAGKTTTTEEPPATGSAETKTDVKPRPQSEVKPADVKPPDVKPPDNPPDVKPPSETSKPPETKKETPVPKADEPAVKPAEKPGVSTEPRPEEALASARKRHSEISRKGVVPEAVAFYNSGTTELDKERFDAAVQAFEACVKLAPKWKEAHFNLALSYRKAGRLEDAVAEYEKCIEMDPSDSYACNNLATVCELLHRPADAEAAYRKALKIAPTLGVARFNLAELLFSRDRLEEARKHYEELLKSPKTLPKDVDPSLLRLRLATCLADLGEKGKVADLVNKACADTDNPYYLREGARQFYSLGQYARAKELFERAYKVSGSDAESAYALSLFLMRVPDAAMRNIELAGIYVEQAVTAEPENARFISAMAEAAWARGDKEKARTLAEQALKLAPDSYAIRKQAEAYKAE